MMVESINPIKFTSVPLTRICLNSGPDNKIDSIYRTRICKPHEINILYPKAVLPENFDPLKTKKKIWETNLCFEALCRKKSTLNGLSEKKSLCCICSQPQK